MSSGMYYSKPQCQHSFEVYKIKFSKYIITMIRLLRYHFLKVAQQLSTNTKLETTKMFTAATHNSTHSFTSLRAWLIVREGKALS